MKHILLATIVASLALEAHATDWGTTDKALGAGVVAAQFVDWKQTRNIAAHPDKWHETNPILGQHPTAGRVNVYFLATTGLELLAADQFPEYRKAILGGVLALEISVVKHNYNLGISASF